MSFDFPTNPASGTVVMVPDGSYRVWDSTKWRASPSSSTITTGPFLPLAGGVMSGALSLFGNATSALHAVPLQQLNAATAGGPFLPLTGGTVAPGNIVIGAGTGTPTLQLNGAAGTNKGIYWQNAGTNRWRFQTDASENLGLYAYDASGAYIDYGVLFNSTSKTVSFDFGISGAVTRALPAGAAGNTFATVNTGTNAAIGSTFTYQSVAGGSGFDTNVSFVSIFDPVFIAGQTPALEALWIVSQSPNDTTHNWGCNIAEMNVVNRGADRGWARFRGDLLNPTGGLLMVAEGITFGGTGGGEGKNATYAYAVAPSADTNSTGFPVKFYNCFLAEPNSAVGLTGRAFYATGDVTGVASQYPYGPMQTDGTWLHGIDHTKAVYMDNHAQTMLTGQSIAWINGTTAAPTATATIGAFGSGASASLSLMPAAGGSVYIGNGTGAQQLVINGASTQSTAIDWQSNGVTRWEINNDTSGNNMNVNAYDSSGAFLGRIVSFWQGPLLAYFQSNCMFTAQVGFNNTNPIAKRTGWGAATGTATRSTFLTSSVTLPVLAEHVKALIDDLTAYGLIGA